MPELIHPSWGFSTYTVYRTKVETYRDWARSVRIWSHRGGGDHLSNSCVNTLDGCYYFCIQRVAEAVSRACTRCHDSEQTRTSAHYTSYVFWTMILFRHIFTLDSKVFRFVEIAVTVGCLLKNCDLLAAAIGERDTYRRLETMHWINAIAESRTRTSMFVEQDTLFTSKCQCSGPGS